MFSLFILALYYSCSITADVVIDSNEIKYKQYHHQRKFK